MINYVKNQLKLKSYMFKINELGLIIDIKLRNHS